MADTPNPLDPAYVYSQLVLVYTALGVTPTGRGTGATDIAQFVDYVIASGGWIDGNAGYWGGNPIGDPGGKIARDLAAQGGGGSIAATGPPTGSTNANPNGNLLTPQLGLLEDDLAYRLSLLCVNVLQPLVAVYPGLVVISGFRQVNDGITQHELGEAVDLQISNQSDALLYEVADYIQKNLNFDQLVLNWTNIGSGEGWIHVSFSATSLRGQVLTKDYADGFHTGLFLVSPLSGDAAAAALNDQANADMAILAELQNIQTRQMRLGQQSTILSAASANANTSNTNTVTANTTMSTISGANISVTILSSPDVSGWTITAHIKNFGMAVNNMHIQFDRQVDWPTQNINGVLQQATLWIFLNINGHWYGAAAQRLRLGQIDKAEQTRYSTWISSWLNKPALWGPMADYVPKVGEQVGIMVTQGSEYLDSNWTVQERSDILFISCPPTEQR